MQAFEVSGDDAVIRKRIRKTARDAAFERPLKLFAREAPTRRYGSRLPAARNGGVERRRKPVRFIGRHLSRDRLWEE